MPTKREKRPAKTGRAAAQKSTVGVPSTRRSSQAPASSKAASPRSTKRKHAASEQSGNKKVARARGVVRRAAASVRRTLARVTGRNVEQVKKEEKAKKVSIKQTAARVTKRETDIPMDRISQTYSPTQTSLKGPFRTSGADHQRDQEFAQGVADDRWNDEDRLTNKSGDPRIGTHGRSYEPGEARAASGRNRKQ